MKLQNRNKENLRDAVHTMHSHFLQQLSSHLGCHTDRAGVQVTLPHHGAAQDNQRRSAEAKLIRTQKRCDHNIMACKQRNASGILQWLKLSALPRWQTAGFS